MIINNLENKHYLVLDTETTGIDENAEILQISILNEKNEILLNEYVKPAHTTSWDTAEKINHISPNVVADKPLLSEYSNKISELLHNADFIVGYNTAYDLRLLEQSGIKLSQDIYDKSVDVMHEFSLSQDNRIPFSNQLINIKLKDCAEFYGYSPDKNNSYHDSVEDCRATLACFKANAAEQLKNKGFIHLDEIGKLNTFFNPSISSQKFSPQLLKILDKLTDSDYLTKPSSNNVSEEYFEEMIDFAIYKYNKHHSYGPTLEFDKRYNIVTCKDLFDKKYSLGSSHFSCPYCLPFAHNVFDISESFVKYESLSFDYGLRIKFDLKNHDFSLYTTLDDFSQDNLVRFNLDACLKYTSLNRIVDNYNAFAFRSKYTQDSNDAVCLIDTKNPNIVNIFDPDYFNLSFEDYDPEDFENKGYVSLNKEDFFKLAKENLFNVALYSSEHTIHDLKGNFDCSNLFIDKLNFLSIYTPDLSLLPKTDLEQIEKIFDLPKFSNVDEVDSVIGRMDEDSFINLNCYLINHKLDDKLYDLEDQILCSAKDLQEGCTIQPQDKGQLIRIIKQTCEKKGWEADLNFIDTSKITDMSCLFASGVKGYKLGLEQFNGDISKWNTSNLTNMSFMFAGTKNFNQPLNNWDTSNVKDMRGMFNGADSFNQPIESWDVSNVTDMSDMFCFAKSFNKSLSNWKCSEHCNYSGMFDGAKSFKSYLPEFPNHFGSKEGLLEELGLPSDFKPEIKKEQEEVKTHKKVMSR